MEAEDATIIRRRIESGDLSCSLERPFYASRHHYENDLRKVWGRNWLWAGHESQIPEIGNYFLFDFGTESVIVVRDGAGDVRAHLNVCRHRGSRVCLERSGKARSFTCPYHAWTYGLDGALRGGRLMPEGFEPAAHGLGAVHLINFQGMLFVCLADNPPPLQPALDRLAPMTAPFDLGNLKVAHEATYPVPANWKLALENYLECYHCAPAHQAYSQSHSLKDPLSMTPELLGGLEERSRKIGLPTDEFNETGTAVSAAGCDIFYRRYPLYAGYETGSKDGEPLAPPLGKLSGFDGGATDLMIGPLNNFLIYSDHLVAYRFLPRDLQSTDIQTIWMVRGDAVEGRDYHLAPLTWLWHVTTEDDERIIRHNQEGVNSHHYRPGPLSDMEQAISDFYRGYFGMIDD